MSLPQKSNRKEDNCINNRESNELFCFGLFEFTRSDHRIKRVNLFIDQLREMLSKCGCVSFQGHFLHVCNDRAVFVL